MFTGPSPAVSRSRPLIVLVHPDPEVLAVVRLLAGQLGLDVEECADTEGLPPIATRRRIRAVLAASDSNSALQILAEVRRAAPGAEVVLVGADPAGERLLDALKHGVCDCLAEPVNPDHVRRLLSSLGESAGARAHVFALEMRIAEQTEFQGMVGRSSIMQQRFDVIRRMAPYARRVLVTGETGTGKELAARALHRTNPRRYGPMVTVNCPGVDPQQFEQEIAAAEGGTLFLDAISELSGSLQERLRDMLGVHQVHRVHEVHEVHAPDVVVVAASCRDLRAAALAGRFDPDLFASLAGVVIDLPPLRDRREDIPFLTASFVRECGSQLGRDFDGLTTEAERLLMTAAWPGNVRELRHAVERACMLARDHVITERDLGMPAGQAGAPARPREAALPRVPSDGVMQLSRLEREHIVDALRQVNGNRMAAAKVLGISRRALYRRLERHHIAIPAARPRSLSRA